ncbi:MAG: hypothetical protein KC619_09305 [Myxococcales bacterium]|nr:hypothetical protein [Myxococcales bacterium]
MNANPRPDFSDLYTTIPRCGSYRAGVCTLFSFQEHQERLIRSDELAAEALRVWRWERWIRSL